MCGISSSFNASASSCKRCWRPRPVLMWDPARLLHTDPEPAVIQNFQPFFVLCYSLFLRPASLIRCIYQLSSNHLFQLPSLFGFLSFSPQGLLAILHATKFDIEKPCKRGTLNDMRVRSQKPRRGSQDQKHIKHLLSTDWWITYYSICRLHKKAPSARCCSLNGITRHSIKAPNHFRCKSTLC